MSREDYGSGQIKERAPGHWQVTIELSRDPVTGGRRRNRFTVLGKRRDAQAALRAALARRDTGIAVTADRITVADWLLGWLERHVAEGHIGARAHDRYRGIIHRHLIPALGGIRLQQLRPDHIADLKVRWLSGRDSTAAGPLSGATVHKHLVVLRVALNEALKSGLISVNPATAVRAPSAKRQEEQRALTEQEILLLLKAATGTAYDAPIRLTLATGLREGELLGLRWTDVDLEARTLEVRQALSYVEGTVLFKEPKSQNSRRTIELSALTVKMLQAHRAAQAEKKLRLGAIWKESGLVFPSMVGTPWLPRPFYRGYRNIVNRSALDAPGTVDFHCLRHTAASQWIRRGVDVFTVSRRLGHASASFTMDVYSHLLRGQQKAAAEALDYLLTGAG